MELAVLMVPYSFILYMLNSLRQGNYYPSLGKFSYILAFAQIILAVASAAYMYSAFDELIEVRLGSYTTLDVVFGTIVFLLVMEYSRRTHLALFILNVFLFIYALYGFLPGPFSHPGIPLRRVLTAMSVEFGTGVFEKLPQTALIVIGAFMLFVAILQGFGVAESIVRTVVTKASRSARLIPQATVVSSMAVGMVTGSGAANAATTGSVTIPLMKRVGLPSLVAAAIESAASIGSQIMPPVMGIGAFIMASFLGVSYFEVALRGFVPGIIYYLGLAVAVYLTSLRFLPKKLDQLELDRIVGKPLTAADYFKTLVFLLGISLLIALMGYYFASPTYAALNASWIVLAVSIAGLIYFNLKSTGKPGEALKGLKASLLKTIDLFAAFTSDLTLLLATLGIMTGLLTITGVPTKIGFMLMNIGVGDIYLLAAIGFLFGYIVGLGLPPSVTYILTVIVIAPYFIEAGFSPWIAHFYAFLIGVFSELSPPTSVAVAVTAKIADAPFTRTMIRALEYSIPLIILMPAVIVHPELVVEPSLEQVETGVLIYGAILVISIGLLHKIYSSNSILNGVFKAALLALGVATIASRGAAFDALGVTSLVTGLAIISLTRRTRS